ncbi:hypothetical protein [Pseudoclavibacter sp. JSM 162008]|uniref:phage tail tube protein n=1 Tax=Pseudoclavibacter sp. JSM 162008 TaxID=3229855 RepID=UPI003524C6FB
MGITLTPPEKSVKGLGNLTIIAIPRSGVASPLGRATQAEIAAPTAIDITYSHTPDGFVHTPGYEMLPDDRLTFPQKREERGLATDTLVSTIVYGSAAAVADPLLVEGAEFIIAVRDTVPHNQALATTDKWDFHDVVVNTKVKSPHTNSVRTKVVTYGYQQPVLKDMTAATA